MATSFPVHAKGGGLVREDLSMTSITITIIIYRARKDRLIHLLLVFQVSNPVIEAYFGPTYISCRSQFSLQSLIPLHLIIFFIAGFYCLRPLNKLNMAGPNVSFRPFSGVQHSYSTLPKRPTLRLALSKISPPFS